ncbi:MAG: uracil-DNA glycosylase [Puniceicoccales bacterium]|nr:uracil-DNA glycosylase [Puniceicoccales bacterium]
MGSLSREEILQLLLREVELLAAEGERTLPIAEEALESFRQGSVAAEHVPNPTTSPAENSAAKDPKENAIPPPPTFSLPDGDKATRWNALREIVLGCPVCRSHVKPTLKVVFGVGNLDADIFFCGEAPGADEERHGEPFVGRAGQLLNKIIEAMGLHRSDVYIGNIMNWRPEMPTPYGNRPPTQAEMEFCLPYLRAQVEIVSPKAIVALGATAVNGLLGYDPDRRLGDVRGRWHQFAGLPLMVTYHPSYLLRNPSPTAKRSAWEDLLQVMERISLPISERQRNFFL